MASRNVATLSCLTPTYSMPMTRPAPSVNGAYCVTYQEPTTLAVPV